MSIKLLGILKHTTFGLILILRLTAIFAILMGIEGLLEMLLKQVGIPYPGDSVYIRKLDELTTLVSQSGITLQDTWVTGLILLLVSGIAKTLWQRAHSLQERQAEQQLHLLSTFPQLEMLQDPSVRESAISAIKNLTIDNVDMGLFYFGKIFEVQLKSYLTEAKTYGLISVSSKDLQSLKSMIDCLERNNIRLIEGNRRSDYLHFLREQRNERVHGEVPSLEERKKLMRQATFLADLYLDCIIALQQRRAQLQNLNSDTNQGSSLPSDKRSRWVLPRGILRRG